MYVDTSDERIRWALRIKMAKANLPSISAAILRCIEESCERELREVDVQIAAGIQPEQPKSKRGRKPK